MIFGNGKRIQMDGRYENRGNREKGKREGRIEGIMKENRQKREKGGMDWWEEERERKNRKSRRKRRENQGNKKTRKY